ncbi:hypothetical protein BU26DRAFT_519790 [Trematosphaeria pertusa]|uniref:Uncharacterized protein n=1 Tax=Trematosphaeria pertusa TaxID=390896 RepID=A0A6A6IC61_9PLEO|nr:uncharacterized protein BU26DRAFT_519790 [Trematosphaeria pertusa]KAF2248006.1 hypothetical protein BU26DRAFT_519790 [Trematosphaeria pertusa]
MSLSQTRRPRFMDHTNDQRAVHGSSPAPYRADAAVWDLADWTTGQSDPGRALTQDPFAYYKAFFTTDVPSGGGVEDLMHHDGSTNLEEPIDAQCAGDQQRCKQRAAPYNLAVRFANRSNGAPLATIVERGSVSTLGSHGSLLSVGQFPSIRIVENASPARSSHKPSRNLDEMALQNIQEEARQEQNTGATDLHTRRKLGEDYCGSNSNCTTTAPAETTFQGSRPPAAPQTPLADDSVEVNGLKGFFRGVLHNARGGYQSRSRSQSSSMTNASPPPQAWGERPDTNGRSSQSVTGENFRGSDEATRPAPTVSVAIGSSLSRPRPPTQADPESHATDCKGSRSDFEPSAGVYPLRLPHSPPTLNPRIDELSSTPHLLPLPDALRPIGHKERSFSVRSVPPEPRDATQDHVLLEATTDPRLNEDDVSTRHTLDLAPIYRTNAPSVREFDHRARDSSQNASFCSTRSTSYSGTVLGVDLDLQLEFPHPARRSVTPVWFTPESETKTRQQIERGMQPAECKQPPFHSITSSVLPALLPIAAAEGIVRPNQTTPQLSFFSPSGNLIQAEDSSSPSSNTSHSSSYSYYTGTPTLSTSYYNKNPNTLSAHAALSASIGLPPIRPAPVPLITPPHSTAPLPEHLRHHHNYQHAEKSQIVPDSEPYSDTTVGLGSVVKGCGGVIRTNSLTPHSGVRRSPVKSKPKFTHATKFGRSILSKGNNEASKSRFSILSSWPSTRKGRTLKKTPPLARSPSRIGPIAGHALRVCFCQPYDGAGKPSAEVGCSGGRPGQCHDEAYAREAREEDSPIARIVTGGEERQGKGRKRSDSGVSIAIRVGVVGG